MSRELDDARRLAKHRRGAVGVNGHPDGIPGAGQPPEWELPVPLDTLGPPPPFPLDLLPGDAARFVEAVARATCSPPDYAGTLALGVAAGLVGAAYRVDVKDGYSEPSSVYACAVARKGGGKTPGLGYVMEPVVAEQVRRRRAGDKVPALVDDITVEKMADLMQKSPRGLLMIRDELTALFAGFNQYKAGGKGTDRQFYLKAHSGLAHAVERKDPDTDPIFVAHPCLSIAGGIQPSVLAKYTVDSDDGLFDRFLFAFPDPPGIEPENGLTVPRLLRDSWSDALAALRSLTMTEDPDAGPRPFFLKLTPDAWDVWVEWTRWLSDESKREDFAESLRGPAAKLRGYAARLALVSFALREAFGEGLSRQMDHESMRRGAELAKYFFAHARRVWTIVGRDDRTAQARRVLNWVRGRGQPSFSRRDAWRYLNRSFDQIEDLQLPLRLLVQLGWLRYQAIPEPIGPGRPPTAVYEVHPSLLTIDEIDKTPPAV